MREPRPRRTTSHTRRAGDISIRQLGDLVEVDRLTDQWLESYRRGRNDITGV